MKHSKSKQSLSIFEYGAIVAFVAVTLFVSTQIVQAGGFAALNEVAMNAVISSDLGSDSSFKAD